MRVLSYVESINETFHQMLDIYPEMFLLGQGLTSPWYVGSTTTGLLEKFGAGRIIDTPVSENAVTGAGIGAALAGMRPVVVHPRLDFMYLAMDQIANHAANWYYMFGGQLSVPITIWGIINRGGEQAAQHSQAIHAMFSHIPGLKVVMPSTPYDAKGLLVSSIEDNNPVIFIDDRWLYSVEGNVPDNLYRVPIGKGVIRREGDDLTIVGSSWLVHEAIHAASILQKERISAEVIDIRSVKPLDDTLIFNSVEKTGKLVIVDGGWRTCGLAAEISARVAESELIKDIQAPIIRVTLPDTPAPASSALEKCYYRNSGHIINAVKRLTGGSHAI